MKSLTGALAVISWASLMLAGAGGAWAAPVTMNLDEADAVLDILEKRARGEEVVEGDWTRLFTSEPYVRLKKREASMRRDFTDDEFRAFVLSAELAATAKELRASLDGWARVDLSGPVSRASAYLPEGAAIRATIYPMIKPKPNSFVFEVDSDPAIFMFLDPSVPPARLENTLAHELHHVGFGTRCPAPEVDAAIGKLPAATAWVVTRLGAFGEGFAMLAAAGGPDVHPHAESAAEERDRWDRDVARAAGDMRTIERFIRDATTGKLKDEERQQTFFSFYGEQGPWYTVGWLMASTIERELGRQALLEAFCDPRSILATYNRAVAVTKPVNGATLPRWADDVVKISRGE